MVELSFSWSILDQTVIKVLSFGQAATKQLRQKPRQMTKRTPGHKQHEDDMQFGDMATKAFVNKQSQLNKASERTSIRKTKCSFVGLPIAAREGWKEL